MAGDIPEEGRALLELDYRYKFENIHQQVYLLKFHGNPTLTEGVDSTFNSADSLL